MTEQNQKRWETALDAVTETDREVAFNIWDTFDEEGQDKAAEHCALYRQAACAPLEAEIKRLREALDDIAGYAGHPANMRLLAREALAASPQAEGQAYKPERREDVGGEAGLVAQEIGELKCGVCGKYGLNFADVFNVIDDALHAAELKGAKAMQEAAAKKADTYTSYATAERIRALSPEEIINGKAE